MTDLDRWRICLQNLDHSQVSRVLSFASTFETKFKRLFPPSGISVDDTENALVLEWSDQKRYLEISFRENGVVEWCSQSPEGWIEGEDFLTDRTFELVAKWC